MHAISPFVLFENDLRQAKTLTVILSYVIKGNPDHDHTTKKKFCWFREAHVLKPGSLYALIHNSLRFVHCHPSVTVRLISALNSRLREFFVPAYTVYACRANRL